MKLTRFYKCPACGYNGKYDIVVRKEDLKILFLKCRNCGYKEEVKKNENI
jgi:transcription elongation factor Elf1